MGMDFPVPVAADEVFTDPVSGKSYKWDSVAWKLDASGGATASEFVLKAGDSMTGALHLPSAQPVAVTESTHKQYVDTAIAAKSLYQGVWQVAANSPDLTPSAAILHSYSWVANTVDPNNPETALAALPGIGGTLIAAGDTVIWNANTSIYEHVRSPASVAGDFVEVTGDTMTGGLIAPSVEIKAAAHAASTVKLFASASPNGGRIDFQTADGATRKGYIGYGNDTDLILHAETGKQWRVTGGLTVSTGNLTMAAGRIDFQNSAYVSKDATNNGLFFHTPGGAVSNFHVSGTGNMLTIASGGVTTYGGLTVNGTATINDTLSLSSATLTCPEGSKIQFNNTACFIASTSNTRIRYDSGDQHNFFIGVSKFLAVSVNGVEIWGTFTDSLATDLPGSTSDDGGANIGNVLAMMAAEIKILKAQVATLMAQPKGKK